MALEFLKGLGLVMVGLIFLPVTVAMLASAWFMLNALVYGIASEFETHVKVGDLQWFNPFRLLVRRNYTERGNAFRERAIKEFKRSLYALLITCLLTAGTFLVVRFVLKTPAG